MSAIDAWVPYGSPMWHNKTKTEGTDREQELTCHWSFRETLEPACAKDSVGPAADTIVAIPDFEEPGPKPNELFGFPRWRLFVLLLVTGVSGFPRWWFHGYAAPVVKHSGG